MSLGCLPDVISESLRCRLSVNSVPCKSRIRSRQDAAALAPDRVA